MELCWSDSVLCQELLICVLVATSCFSVGQEARQNLQQPTYESWISGYRKGPLGGSLGDNHHIQLRIEVIEGDDLQPDAKTASVSGNHYRTMRSGYAVSTEGTVSFIRLTSSAIQGGGPESLPAENFEKLKPLLTSLPDDGSRLPPPGHRLVVQVERSSEIEARVYDRANLPEKILEILRLSGTEIKPLVVDFPPDRKWPMGQYSASGIASNAVGIRMPKDMLTLAVSPGGSFIVQQALYYRPKTQIIDGNRSTVAREVNEPQAGRRQVYISHAWFTPDGHFLLLQSNLPALHIFDTSTWQQLDTLPSLPSRATTYYPSSDWKHGVAVSPTGEVHLWDATDHRNLARLDTDGELQSVSFSPDASLVALVSVRQNKDGSSTFHLRIWETDTGTFVRELMPLEQIAHDEIGDPMWWPDGNYLFAAIREGHSGGYVIGIWNTQSGRYRGGFSGCGYSDDPSSILLRGRELFKLCRDGNVLMWDIASAIQKVTDSESR